MSPRTKSKKKLYTIEFILSPGEKTYFRSVKIDPDIRVFDLVRKMTPRLAQRYPELFGAITARQLKSWKYYFGSIDHKNEMEELEPGLSLMDHGVFPGSVGPAACFK